MTTTIRAFVAMMFALVATAVIAGGLSAPRLAENHAGQDAFWQVQAHAGPSYPCSGQLPPVATTICNNAALSLLDREMSAAYAAALARNPGLQAAQNAWIAELTACNTSIPCIQQQYLTRISALTGKQVVLQQAQSDAPLPSQPIVAVLSTQGQASYYGSVTCGRNRHQFSLTIKNAGAGKLTAQMYDFYRWSQSGIHKLETLVGEYDPQTNSMSFVRDNEQLHAVRWLGNKIIVVQDGVAPEFTIEDANCKDGSMYRFDPSLTARPPGPGTPGSFFQAPDPRGKCDVLVKWLSQQDTLFDKKVPDGSRNYAKLYVDDLFVPVFGVPYDKLSVEMLNKNFLINPGVSRNYSCYNEPFVKEKWRRLEPLHGAGFRGGHHKVYIDWYVRRQRSIQKDVVNAMENAKDIYAVKGISAYLSEEEIKEFLSPPKVKALEDQLKTLKAQRAFQDASQYMTALNGKTMRGQFEQANVYRKSKPDFHRWMTAEGKKQLDSSMNSAFKHTAERLLQPVLDDLSKYPQTLEGLIAVKAAIDKSVIGAVSDYRPPLPVIETIRAEQDAREAKIKSDLEAEIAGFKPDLAGLKASVAWIETLTGAVDNTLPSAEVTSLRKMWDTNRETLLEQAVPTFEAQIKGATPEEVDAILKTYLHPKYDMSRPIALEYELIALSN